MNEFFKQLLLDGQADFALAQVTVLVPFKKIVAAATKQAKREGYVVGLEMMDMDFTKLEADLADEAEALAQRHWAEYDTWDGYTDETRAAKKAMWPLERLRSYCLNDLVQPFRYSAQAHIDQAEARYNELVEAGLVAAGLTMEQVHRAYTFDREAKRKMANAKANLAGKGLTSRLDRPRAR